MALNSGDPRSRNESRVFESLDELATDLAEYISQLSEISVKERGVFTIALTGGPLISLLGYVIIFLIIYLSYVLLLICRIERLYLLHRRNQKKGRNEENSFYSSPSFLYNQARKSFCFFNILFTEYIPSRNYNFFPEFSFFNGDNTRKSNFLTISIECMFTITLLKQELSNSSYWICKSRKLCEAPYNKTVDWTKWYVFWADERAVAKNHVDSNYKLTKDEFLSKV